MIRFVDIFREAICGKSIGRILMNEILWRWWGNLEGIVFDLACGKEPSYWRALGLKEDKKICLVTVDYNPAFRPSVVADLTQPFPFKDAVADTVIVSSFLYIVPEPQTFLHDVWRVLKSGGWLFLTVPLVYPYTPEPTDYWRFTEEGMRFLLRRSGFVEHEIVPVGGRFSSAVYLLSPFLRPRWLLRPPAYWLSLRLDAMARRFGLPDCPIGYVCRARKP